MRKITLIVAFLAILTGCNDQESALTGKIVAKISDPPHKELRSTGRFTSEYFDVPTRYWMIIIKDHNPRSIEVSKDVYDQIQIGQQIGTGIER